MARGRRLPVVGERWDSESAATSWVFTADTDQPCPCGKAPPHTGLVDDQLGPELPVCPVFVAKHARPA